MDRKVMGRRLRSWMVDAGMTYDDLATRLSTDEDEVKPTTVKSWISGNRGMSFDRAEQIADVFGKSLDELACREFAKAS